MITKVIMPKLGETMEDGILNRWLKKEGDKVEKGENLFEVTTDKATFEVESPAAGFLRKIIIQSDSEAKVAVIQPVAFIADSMNEALPSVAGSGSASSGVVGAGFKPAPTGATAPQEGTGTKTSAPAAESGRIKASPLAKEIAQQNGIDLSQVQGTGPGGRITEKDVQKAISAQSSGAAKPESGAKAESQVISLTPMRSAIAKRLSQSKHDAPHFYLQIEIDMTEAVKAREKNNKSFSFNDLTVKAVAEALKKYPLMNSTFVNEKIHSSKDVNVGVAISVENGLVVPVVKNAGNKTVQQIKQDIGELARKSKSGKFSENDFSGGTFTISNLGMYNIDVFTAIINPPEVGILAVGKIKESLIVREGSMKIAQIMKVSLSCDHRVIDGVYGAQFLAELKRILENPNEII